MFLQSIEREPNICEAERATGISRQDHYRWIKDPDYKERFDKAFDRGVDVLEAEAVRRALHGTEEPVYSGGKRAVDVVMRDGKVVLHPQTLKPIEIPASVTRKSDTLLMFLLNGNRSGKYRSRTDSRIVDAEGKDRTLFDLAAVRAWMQSEPDGGE